MEFSKPVARILNAASRTKTKSNYTVYTSYKHDLMELGLSSMEYEAAVRRLADVLGV